MTPSPQQSAELDEFFDELDSKTPRVSACIQKVMRKFPGTSKTEQARYYEEVHQELAPLARQLETELAEAKANMLEMWSARRSPAGEGAEAVAWEVTFRRPTGMDRLIVRQREDAEKEVKAELITSIRSLVYGVAALTKAGNEKERNDAV